MSRIALITGGVTGIGAATAALLKNSGYTVVANYFGNDTDAEAFHSETGIPVRAWDVADFHASQKGVAAVAQDIGPIDILVNNAGFTRDSTLHMMTPEQWHSVIDVYLGGCFNMCRAVIQGMRERRFGRIVNISSVNGLTGRFGQCNYAAAKAGMIGFTKSLALEGAARGITVNAIAPGYTDTGLVRALSPKALEATMASVPIRRLATPQEIARGVLFLVADEAGFITGETISINGGKYMA